MKCNKCHEEMKLKEIEVGKDSAGNPVYNLYAFCYHCKTKVNIDKLKKAAKERKEAEQLADAKREAAQSFQICCHKRYYGSSTCLSKNSGDPFPECYFPCVLINFFRPSEEKVRTKM